MAHGGGLPRRPGAALNPPPRGSRACRRPRRAPHCGNGFNGSLWAPPGCFAHSHGRLQAALSPLGPPCPPPGSPGNDRWGGPSGRAPFSGSSGPPGTSLCLVGRPAKNSSSGGTIWNMLPQDRKGRSGEGRSKAPRRQVWPRGPGSRGIPPWPGCEAAFTSALDGK